MLTAVLCGLTLDHVDAFEGVVKRRLLHRSVQTVPFAHSSGHCSSGGSMGPGSLGSAWKEKNDCSRYGLPTALHTVLLSTALGLPSCVSILRHWSFHVSFLNSQSSLMTLRTHLIVTAPVPYGVFVLLTEGLM